MSRLARLLPLVVALAACSADAGEQTQVAAATPTPDSAAATAAGDVATPDGAAAGAPAAAGPLPATAATGGGPRFGSSASESAACMQKLQQRLAAAADAERADSTGKRPPAGHSAAFARGKGWYPEMPAFRDGSILPCSRIVAYYGHPSSTRMGALGEFPKDEMLRRFRRQVQEWERADPETPVVPALHMVSVVAQGDPGTSGHYRTITGDAKVNEVYGWAKEAGAIFIVDLQVGTDDVRNVLPPFDWILKNPDVHLGVDPEFYMRDGVKPGRKIGTMYASDINFVSEHLAKLVREHDLPPKVLVIHRFTRNMVRNSADIRLRPEVNVVMHMDGWGAPWLKFDSYRDYMVAEPVQFGGWKNFYHNDTKKGDPLVTPQQMMRLHPPPLYIQYQ